MMSFPFYTGKPENQNRPEPMQLPISKRYGQDDPAGYLAEQGLIDAVNVAIVLGQPLLLTGEAGTGKTQLAYAVAGELGFGEPLKFETKSDSRARDLFYYYDTVGRFHAAQTGQGSVNSLDYMTYNALGEAILHANDINTVQPYLPPGFEHNGKNRSVVLIDEVDKAPRDFPNDILNEIDDLYFKVPELGNAKISAESDMRPIVFITSNSEKHLPDAFLRRCIFYNIEFPKDDRLVSIVKSRVGSYVDNNEAFLSDVIDFFQDLRKPGAGLDKKPATAELLGWIIALKEISKVSKNPMRDSKNYNNLVSSLSVLLKNSQDLKRAKQRLDEWLKTQ